MLLFVLCYLFASVDAGDVECVQPIDNSFPPPGLGALCTVDGQQGSCDIRKTPCSTVNCIAYALYCQLPDVLCSTNGTSCRQSGINGVCTARSDDVPFPFPLPFPLPVSYQCTPFDKNCSSLYQQCAQNGRFGYCNVLSEVVRIECRNATTYSDCEASIAKREGAIVCSGTDMLCTTNSTAGSPCSSNGIPGVCTEPLTRCYSPSMTRDVCPKPANNATSFTAQEIEAYCSTNQGPGCGTSIMLQCSQPFLLRFYDGSVIRCQLAMMGFSSFVDVQCKLKDQTCSKLSQGYCVENGAIGVCRKVNGTNNLECYDVADQCPVGKSCELETTSTSLVNRTGICTNENFCTPNNSPCTSNNGTCFSDGIEGTCGHSFDGFFYDTDASGCKKKNSLPCTASSLYESCVLDGVSASCAYSNQIVELKCPELQTSPTWIPCRYGPNGEQYCPDYTATATGIFDGRTFPATTYNTGDFFTKSYNSRKRQITRTVPPTVAPNWFSTEDCHKRLASLGVLPTCAVSRPCTSMWNNGRPELNKNQTCYVDGHEGVCQESCYVKGRMGPVTIPCQPADKDLGQVLKWIQLLCDGIKSVYVPPICMNPNESIDRCQFSANFDLSCITNLVSSTIGFGFESKCLLAPSPCKKADQICIENGQIGECKVATKKRAGGALLECVDPSDKCPAGSACTIVRPAGGVLCQTQPTLFFDRCGICGGDGSFCGSGLSSPTTNITVDGLCSKQFNCELRIQQCGSVENQLNSCWDEGFAGTCITKNAAQKTALENCLSSPGALRAQCYSLYTTCFTGCRYPTQICDSLSQCFFTDDSTTAPAGPYKTELRCTNTSTTPNSPLIYQGRLVLITVQLDNNGNVDLGQLIKQFGLSEWTELLYDYSSSSFMRPAQYVALRQDFGVTRARFRALNALVSTLGVTNGVKSASLVLIADQTQGGCQKCSPGYSCVDKTCLRLLPHGRCIDGAPCVCDSGFTGSECDMTSSPRPTDTPPSGLLLSQWLFARDVGVDGTQSLVNAVLKSCAPTSQSILSVIVVASIDLDANVAKIYGKTSSLTFDQESELLGCWKLLASEQTLRGFAAFSPRYNQITVAPMPASSSQQALAFVTAAVAIGVATI